MRTLLGLLLFTCTLTVHAQSTVALTADGVASSIDFADYNGTGIAPDPTGGELNSNNWSVLGLSDGDVPFGGSSLEGDFEGQTNGTGTTGGGLYAYSNGTNSAIWVQPTSSDFSPGSLILKLNNATGGTVSSLSVDYRLHVLNDGDRSNSFNLSYSTDGLEFTPLGSLDYASPEAADGTLSSINRFSNINDIELINGGDLFLQWTGDDLSGAGSRDEFGLGNIIVTPFSGTATPIVGFSNATLESDEAADIFSFDIMVSDPVGCEINLTLDPSSSAQVGIDFLDTASGIYFFSVDQTTRVSVKILDDNVAETVETIVFNLNSANEDCAIGGGSQLVITINDNDSGSAESYTIGEINVTNSNGAYLFQGETVEVTGTVYGINLRPDSGGDGDGLQFTINDGTGGIVIFSLLEEFGYTVQEGDIVRVVGTVDNFLGLGEIIPSVIELISSGNPLPDPQSVLTLNESSESELIRLEYVELVDPEQWNPGGSDFSVDITNGIDVYEMRIDNQVDLFSANAIQGVFNLVGIGGQFDSGGAPFTEGYNISPRSITDVELVSQGLVSVSFESGAVDVDEASAPSNVTLNIALNEASNMDCVVNVVAHPSTTATIGSDFSLPSAEINIPANSTNFEYVVDIISDEEFEENESIWLSLSQVSGACQPALPAFKKINIIDDDEPEIPDVVSIGSLKINDDNGVPLSDGFEVSIEGVVYGGNLRPSGLQFTIIDNTAGMGVFSENENLGYTVTEGDLIRITGTIGHFSGLTQINPTSIELLETNQTLVGASVVGQLDEQSESFFVSLGCVSLVSEDQWSGAGSGFNVDVTDGDNVWTVRVDADIDLFTSPAPTGNFLVSGIGGQFDSAAPFDSGYQLLPRYAADIDEDFCEDNMDIGIASFAANGLSLYPNPAENIVRISALENIGAIRVFNVLGQEMFYQKNASAQVELSVNAFSKGTYFVIVELDSGHYQTKFIKH